jgi:hypothetical protein
VTPDPRRTVDHAGPDERPMGRTYARVIAIEVLVLAALWLLQVGFGA